MPTLKDPLDFDSESDSEHSNPDVSVEDTSVTAQEIQVYTREITRLTKNVQELNTKLIELQQQITTQEETISAQNIQIEQLTDFLAKKETLEKCKNDDEKIMILLRMQTKLHTEILVHNEFKKSKKAEIETLQKNLAHSNAQLAKEKHTNQILTFQNNEYKRKEGNEGIKNAYRILYIMEALKRENIKDEEFKGKVDLIHELRTGIIDQETVERINLAVNFFRSMPQPKIPSEASLGSGAISSAGSSSEPTSCS